MNTQKAGAPGGPALSSPSPRQRRSHFSLRGRKKDGLIRGKLRIRSLPGAFLVLGVVVVMVGTALAVAGYWPYRTHRSPQPLGAGQKGPGSPGPQSSGLSQGARGLLTRVSLYHSERMKLLGPVIMGVGLFILICANTVLYENRDRETKMLLAQMRSVLCSVSAVVPSADLSDMVAGRQYQCLGSLPSAHLDILCLQQPATSEPLPQSAGGRRGTPEGAEHERRQAAPFLRSGDTQHARHFRLDHCLASAASVSTLGGGRWGGLEVAAPLPRRSHSLSYRTKPHPHGTHARPAEGHGGSGEDRLTLPSEPAGREPGPDVCVNMAGLGGGSVELLGLEPAEEQRHCSWPRLDLGRGRRYLKLDNKEDSVDRLLDQLEHQCSQSFGSGPFQ